VRDAREDVIQVGVHVPADAGRIDVDNLQPALILLQGGHHLTSRIRLHPRLAKDDPWAITNHQDRFIFTGTGNVEPGPQFLSIAGEANANRGVALLALLKPRQRD
jgi:hypothetical protein